MDPTLPPAPRLPDRPLTADEVHERLSAVVGRDESATDAISAPEADGCTLIADVDAVTEGLVGDDHFPPLVPLLIEIWRVYVPLGTRGVNLTRAGLRAAILHDATALSKALQQRSEKSLARYLAGLDRNSPGSHSTSCSKWRNRFRREWLPRRSNSGVLGSVLRAVIDELDGVNCGR